MSEADDETRRAWNREPLRAAIHLADPDVTWPAQYQAEAAKIRAALGARVLMLEHVGSTSIPGILAKPILDILLAVADSTAEDAYVPALAAQGFGFHLREPDWHQHRLLKGASPLVNLHVFTAGSPEIVRMLAFRDRCRTHPEELRVYQKTKRALASRVWEHVQDYADAKGEVVEAIIARALAEPSPAAPAAPAPAGR